FPQRARPEVSAAPWALPYPRGPPRSGPPDRPLPRSFFCGVEREGGPKARGGGDLPIGPTRRGAHRLPGQLAPRGGGAAAAAAARLAHGRGVPPRGLNRRPHSSGTGY
ncbi:unnamed protein product, partial [Prorocentrum cordatum]